MVGPRTVFQEMNLEQVPCRICRTICCIVCRFCGHLHGIVEGRLGLDSEGQDLRLGAALSSRGAWESPSILQTPFLKARTETSLLPTPQHKKSKGNVSWSRKGRTHARCEACAVAFELHRFSSPSLDLAVVSAFPQETNL